MPVCKAPWYMLSISIFRSLWILHMMSTKYILQQSTLSISIFRSLWILQNMGCSNNWRKPLSISIFRSLWILPMVKWWLKEKDCSFNLHFQEPLNLTRLIHMPPVTAYPFNLHFQEPLNLTKPKYLTGVLANSSFNLHFQEPLNLTLQRERRSADEGNSFNLHFQEPLNLTELITSLTQELKELNFQSPFSGAFESYNKCKNRRGMEVWSFNLHFQEPLNLTPNLSLFITFYKLFLSISIFRSLWILRASVSTIQCC